MKLKIFIFLCTDPFKGLNYTHVCSRKIIFVFFGYLMSTVSMISAFADEISDDLEIQNSNLLRFNIGNIELRSVWGTGVLELTEKQIKDIKLIADDQNIGFSAVGSPLGKFPLTGNFQQQLEGLSVALDYAQIVGAPYVRIFSFYPPEGDDPDNHRNQVIDWIRQMVERAEGTPIKLAHENEKGIFGDTGVRVLDIHKSIDSSSFVCAFDFANFVQCGQHPYEDCWVHLKEYLGYFHIRDALLEGGSVTVPEKGDDNTKRILIEAFNSGFQDFLTIEPHLSGKTDGAEIRQKNFGLAVQALKDILSQINNVKSESNLFSL